METFFPLQYFPSKRSFACMKNIFLIIFWVAELAKCFFTLLLGRLEIRGMEGAAEFFSRLLFFTIFQRFAGSSYMVWWESTRRGERIFKNSQNKLSAHLMIMLLALQPLWWVSTSLMTRFVATICSRVRCRGCELFRRFFGDVYQRFFYLFQHTYLLIIRIR